MNRAARDSLSHSMAAFIENTSKKLKDKNGKSFNWGKNVKYKQSSFDKISDDVTKKTLRLGRGSGDLKES